MPVTIREGDVNNDLAWLDANLLGRYVVYHRSGNPNPLPFQVMWVGVLAGSNVPTFLLAGMKGYKGTGTTPSGTPEYFTTEYRILPSFRRELDIAKTYIGRELCICNPDFFRGGRKVYEEGEMSDAFEDIAMEHTPHHFDKWGERLLDIPYA